MCSWLPALHRFVSSPNLAWWQLFTQKELIVKTFTVIILILVIVIILMIVIKVILIILTTLILLIKMNNIAPRKSKSSIVAPQWQLFPPKELDVKTLENAQQMNSWLAIVGKYKISAKYLETEYTAQFHRDIFLHIKLSYYHHHQQHCGNLD